ncbi:MAG: hypothetical protein NVSMB29_18200 [Candidatus Dormibacteria bacterium]
MSKDEAALEAVDPDRLLHGEDPSSRHRDDAEHWVTVYEELLRYKRMLVRDTESRMAEMTEAARVEITDTDYVIMRNERARFERRLAFWTNRLEQLDGAAQA